MFWVALATLIMMLSGDGDDTRAVTTFLQALHESASIQVKDPGRRAQALHAIETYQRLFVEHREEQHNLAKCVERADRDYRATVSTYQACTIAVRAHWNELREELTYARIELEASLLSEEVNAIEQDLAASDRAQEVLRQSQTRARAAPPPSRRRGVEGVAAQRHLTVPRNSLSLIFGPGLIPTFAQRFAAGPIEAGLIYRRLESAEPPASEQWMVRGGVVFGLFDDTEAGALFIPIELSPNPHFDDITVLVTQNFRFKNLDLAARFSFRTPGNVGWGLNPAAALRYRLSPKLAIDAAVQVPLELGRFSAPQDPRIALQIPIRATWNLTPHLFVLGSTGYAHDDLANPSAAAVPLGAGLGYSVLFGKRVMDITGILNWESLVRFSPPAGQDAIHPGTYHVALGITFHSQAL